MSTPTIRKPVPLDDDQVHAVEAARTPGSTFNEALTHLAGQAAVKSEASTLAALIQLGISKVEDAMLEQAYADIAEHDAVDEDAIAYRKTLRTRQRRTITHD